MEQNLQAMRPVKHVKARPRLIQRSDLIMEKADGSVVVWGQPHAFDLADEQPYERPLTVGPEWLDVDFGWVKRPALVWISNPAPRFPSQPTDEERVAANGLIVEMSMETGVPAFGFVRPGR